MAEPRRHALRRIAREIGAENPNTITRRELERKIDELPRYSGVGDREDIRNDLNVALDGARPHT